MFIQTESTPNPSTLKFLPGRAVMGEGAVADFPSRDSAGRSPLARALFALPDVSRVFFGSDFISVTKTESADWKHMKVPVLAAIMEDLPYLDNRVLPSNQPSLDGRQRLRIQYRLHHGEIERRTTFLKRLAEVFEPFRKLAVGSGKDNANLGHVCGTCRFGSDPKSSVLDPQNRAHEVENLYVVDTSFFPSSAGLNPSLTVAANALRVAAHVSQAHFAT